jgi:hypothetical protein
MAGPSRRDARHELKRKSSVYGLTCCAAFTLRSVTRLTLAAKSVDRPQFIFAWALSPPKAEYPHLHYELTLVAKLRHLQV